MKLLDGCFSIFMNNENIQCFVISGLTHIKSEYVTHPTNVNKIKLKSQNLSLNF